MKKRHPLHLDVVATEKGAFGLPSTKVGNFTYIYIYIYDKGVLRQYLFIQIGLVE